MAIDVAQTPPQPARVRWFRWLARPLVRALFHTLAHITIHGQEHIPARGPYLITPNHLGTYDPPMLLAFWPHAPEALGAADIWQGNDFFGFMSRNYGTHPVNRTGVDTKVVRTALRLLARGERVLIAPEGTRSPEGLREAYPGAAYLALKANIPIIPVGIIGTEKVLKSGQPRWPLTMRIGPLYNLPDLPMTTYRQRKQSLLQATEIIMHQIAALIPTEYRGVYG